MSFKSKVPYIYLLTFLISISSSFYSCKKESNTAITFEEENSIIEDSVLVELNLIKARSNNLLSEKINKVIESHIIDGLQLDVEKNNIETIEEAIDDFKNQYANFNNTLETTSLIFEATFDTEVLYNSSSIITIALTSYINTGGAHGNSYVKLLNFDVVNSKEIITENLINEDQEYFELFKNYFSKNTEVQLSVLSSDFESVFPQPENIGFNSEGVLFLYNNYELDFLGQQLFEFVIPFNEMDTFLNYLPHN